MDRPVAPPRTRRQKSHTSETPAPEMVNPRSTSPTKKLLSPTSTSPPPAVVVQVDDTTSAVSSAESAPGLRPKRPPRPQQPPRFGSPPKRQVHKPIKPCKSDPSTVKIVQPPPPLNGTVLKKQPAVHLGKGSTTTSTCSPPLSPESPHSGNPHQNRTLAQFYGKNNHYTSCPSPKRRVRHSKSTSSTGDELTSTTTVINSRSSLRRGESGNYMNVAPRPPPVKSDSDSKPAPPSSVSQRHLEKTTLTHSPKSIKAKPLEKKRKDASPILAPKTDCSVGSTPKVTASPKTATKQSMRKNFSMQPLPSSSGERGRIVPVRPAPPRPSHLQKKNSGNRLCVSSNSDDNSGYEYVDPDRFRYRLSSSRDLDGLDLTIYSSIDEPSVGGKSIQDMMANLIISLHSYQLPTVDLQKSASENIYAAINPNSVIGMFSGYSSLIW